MSTYLDLNKELTTEQIALKDQTHRFAEEVLRPASIELDRMADPEDVIKEDSVLWEVFRTSYQAGHHTSSFPEALGGAGLGPIERHIVAEEMGWGCSGLAIALGVTSFPFGMAAASGNQAGAHQGSRGPLQPGSGGEVRWLLGRHRTQPRFGRCHVHDGAVPGPPHRL